MADIQVKIVNLANGETVDAELPDDARIGDLKHPLAEKLGISLTQGGGATIIKLGYKFPNPPDPYDFMDEDTLVGKGVKPGSMLALTKEFIAGV